MTMRLSCYLLITACFLASSPLGGAQDLHVVAATGGIAIGRDVNNSTINIQGITAEQMAALVAEVVSKNSMALAARIAPLESAVNRFATFEINQDQMRAALLIIGENDIPPERMGAKFIEIAQQYRVLKA